MSADTRCTPVVPSAGARLAWAAQSRRAHAQLSRLLAPYPLQLLAFSDGWAARQQVLDH